MLAPHVLPWRRTSKDEPADAQTLAKRALSIREKLDGAHACGLNFRRRVQLPLAAAGATLVVLSTGAGIALAMRLPMGVSAMHYGLAPGAMLLLLALTPMDAALVCYGVMVVTFAALGVTATFGLLFARLEAMRPAACSADAPAGAPPCWLLLLHWSCRLAQALSALVLALRLSATLARLRTPRAQLDALWNALGLAFMLDGASETITRAIELGVGVAPPAAAYYAAHGGSALECLAGALALYPSVRVRAQAYVAARGEAMSAALCIASLLGGDDPETIQERARRLFRGLPLDRLSKADLTNPAPDPALHERSLPRAFGEVDAFVTHSWHDDADAKWRALQAWRAGFVASHGREPVVWLDKACISQESRTHIEETLSCLPVFLAGCEGLLAFVGETYLDRLWCVLEVFTYLEMGGTVDRISLTHLFDMGEGAGAGAGAGAGELSRASTRHDVWLERVRNFDVRDCKCALADDKSRLLAMIEQGYGPLDTFNPVIFHAFTAIVQKGEDGARGAWRARGPPADVEAGAGGDSVEQSGSTRRASTSSCASGRRGSLAAAIASKPAFKKPRPLMDRAKSLARLSDASSA